MCIDDGPRHPCSLTSDHVADRQKKGSTAASFLHSGQRIGGLAGLADSDDHILVTDDRFAIAEFGSEIHVNGNARQSFDEELPNETGMERCAASNDMHLLDCFQRSRMAELCAERDVAG